MEQDKLSNLPVPFSDKINEIFYEGMNRETSVCLFGSAATGNWIAGRSDLDLVILVPKEKLEILGRKVREWVWSTSPKLPILDGFAICVSGRAYSAVRLDELARVTYPSATQIDIVDQWAIKNRSACLFGNDYVNSQFPEIKLSELKAYALENFKHMALSNPNGVMPEPTLVLSKLIWTVSWSARMLMLSRGTVCDSKKEALQWIANEYSEIRDLVNLLINDYLKSDEVTPTISVEQSVILRKFCFERMLHAGKLALAE